MLPFYRSDESQPLQPHKTRGNMTCSQICDAEARQQRRSVKRTPCVKGWWLSPLCLPRRHGLLHAKRHGHTLKIKASAEQMCVWLTRA